MGRWREHKRKARADIHGTFALPAVYLTHTAGTPVPCNVRVHSKVAVNQNEFTWPSSPGYLEIDPYVIFDSAEVSKPLKDAFVVVSATEIYRIGVSEPFREQFAKADVNRLPLAECTALMGNLTASLEAHADIWQGVLA